MGGRPSPPLPASPPISAVRLHTTLLGALCTLLRTPRFLPDPGPSPHTPPHGPEWTPHCAVCRGPGKRPEQPEAGHPVSGGCRVVQVGAHTPGWTRPQPLLTGDRCRVTGAGPGAPSASEPSEASPGPAVFQAGAHPLTCPLCFQTLSWPTSQDPPAPASPLVVGGTSVPSL